jgi:putative ABC transport system permease protein
LLSAFAGEDLPFGTPVVPASAVIAAYAVGMLVTPAVAYVPARRAARIPPVAAMRDDASGALPRRSLRWRALAGTAVLIAGAGALVAGLLASGDAALSLTGGGCLLSFTGVIMLGPVISGPVTAATRSAAPGRRPPPRPPS